MRSGARRGGSRRWGSGRCWSTASRRTTCAGWCPICATSPTCRSACIPTSATSRTTGGGSTAGSAGEEFAEHGARWREEGAQIVGGCCGVGPDHIAAARERLEGTVPGHRRPEEDPVAERRGPRAPPVARAGPVDATGAAARCTRCRSPTSSSTLACSSRAAAATWPGSTCSGRGSGAHSAAWTSAAAPGSSPSSSRSTAPRTCTRSTSTSAAVRQHARQRVPQRRRRAGHRGAGRPLPVGARGALRGHRGQPLADAGRPLPAGLDPPAARLLGPQPPRPAHLQAARRAGRRASPTWCSSRSSASSGRLELLDAARIHGRGRRLRLLRASPRCSTTPTQIRRVEELSDAHHLRLGDHDVMVAYLLEVTRAGSGGAQDPGEALRTR